MTKVMMRILFLLILINLSGCLESPDARIKKQAHKAYEAKEYKKASKLYEKLLNSTQKLKTKIHSAEKLVYIYEAIGDFQNKKKNLHFIVFNSKEKNQRIQAKQQIADTEFFKIKDYTEALTHYHELLQLGFNVNQNKLMISRCYYYLNNFDQALFEIDKILKDTKNQNLLFETQLLKGHIYFAQKKYDNSAEIYNHLIQSYPKDSKQNYVLLNLAMSYEESHQYKKAMKALQTLEKFYHSPDFLRAKINHIQKLIRLQPGGKGGLEDNGYDETGSSSGFGAISPIIRSLLCS